MRYDTLAKNIKSAVDDLYENDSTGTYKFALDENFAVYVGWEDGFDAEDDGCELHSKSQPTFCICVKIAENSSSWADMNYVYMPWYEDGEVYDTDISISPNADYNGIAKYLLEDWREMKKLLKKGEITF